MMRRRVLLAALLAPVAARAQDAPAELPEPAPAPPAPPALAPSGAPSQPSQAPAGPPLPPGMETSSGGGVRIALSSDRLAPEVAEALAALGGRLATLPAGRITVEAQVAGPANDASLARRASLARAQAVKAALVAGGLDATRIDLRPLGRVGAGADRVDVLPPGMASPTAESRGR
jgi:outer membrane protein OmpA-like peptidoglycan-associated protein